VATGRRGHLTTPRKTEQLRLDPMASLLAGRKLVTKDGSAAPADALEGKVVLLYFSASWCPPCHRFTPILADFYDDVLSAGGNVEIVYVPGDRARDEMMKYFNDLHGDWLALDMAESSLIQQLNQRYEVSGIPALLAVQTDGSVIEARCREQVQSRGPAAFDAWAAAWRPPAFGGAAHALGGGRGGGVSRLVAGPAGGSGGAADERLSSRSPQYDEDAALAAALAASAKQAAPPVLDEDAALAAALAASVQEGAPAVRTTSPAAALARSLSDEERRAARTAHVLAAAESADTAASSAELQATTAETQFLRIDRAVSRLTEANIEAVAKTAMELLIKIMTNVMKRPGEPKYR
jgi:thiol-disulfide isomerase/thioredoxin